MEMESSLFFCRVLSFYATFEYFTSCRKENVDALYCTRLCTTTVPQVESKDNEKEKHGMEGIHLHHISYKDTIRKLRLLHGARTSSRVIAEWAFWLQMNSIPS